ncbi:MAG TPA: hypothetical protein VIG99_07500 [Myxococcaceae bacterium]|jgi:hypothetical protein
MAVILDFRLDEDVLAENRRGHPSAADPAVLGTTWFVMPIRFSVDETDLLDTSNNVWLQQPLLGFATHMSLALNLPHSTGAATCLVTGAGTLRLQQRGERVRLSCSFNGARAEASIGELTAAIKGFLKRVEASLRTLVPDLTGHPSWPTWFPAS